MLLPLSHLVTLDSSRQECYNISDQFNRRLNSSELILVEREGRAEHVEP